MTTCVTPLSPFDMRMLRSSDYAECSSLSGDDEDRACSDYSLSDIDDALDIKNENASVSVLPIFPAAVEIPVKLGKRPSLALCDVVKSDATEQHATKPVQRRRLSSGGSRCVETNRNATGKWIRRRSTRLSVSRETAKLGMLQVAHLLENHENHAPSPDSDGDRAPPRVTSEFPTPHTKRRAKTLAPVKNFADSPKAATLCRPKRGVDDSESDVVSPLRRRSLSHSRLLDSPRSRSSSIVSNKSTKTDVDCDDSGQSVRQWKHYKRAMEAYRKSAEKAKACADGCDTPNSDSRDGTGTHSVFERVSIYDMWDTRSRASTPSNDERSTIFESPSKDFGSPVRVDLSPAWRGRNELSTPIRKWGAKIDEPNQHLSLDYRTVVKRTPSRSKGGWTLLRQSFRRSNREPTSMRKSMEPDPITDIDSMIGLSDYSDVPKSDVDSDEPVTSFDVCSPENVSEEPEKIVWSGLKDLTKDKVPEVGEFARPSLKMRLAALEKRGQDTSSLVDIICQDALVGKQSRRQSEEMRSQGDLSDTNLRDNEIIRKRNLSLSSGALHFKEHGKSVESIKASHRVFPQFGGNFHTIASPARLAKMLRKQAKRRLLSPLTSPQVAGDKTDVGLRSPRRTTSLGGQCEFTLDKDQLTVLTTEEDVVSSDEVFSIPSPAPRSHTDDCASLDSFLFPSPPSDCEMDFPPPPPVSDKQRSSSPGDMPPVDVESPPCPDCLSPQLSDNKDRLPNCDFSSEVAGCGTSVRLCTTEKSPTSSAFATETRNGAMNESVYQNCQTPKPPRLRHSSQTKRDPPLSDVGNKRSSWLYSNSSCLCETSDGISATNLVYMTLSDIPSNVAKPEPERKLNVPKILVTPIGTDPNPVQGCDQAATIVSSHSVIYNNTISVPTCQGSESDDDYVNYDQFYKDRPLPSSKKLSKHEEAEQEYFNQETILRESMSKLDLDIEGYFSSLGNRKHLDSSRSNGSSTPKCVDPRPSITCRNQRPAGYANPIVVNSNANNSSVRKYDCSRVPGYRDSNTSSVMSSYSGSTRSSCATSTRSSYATASCSGTPVAEHVRVFESGDLTESRKKRRKSKKSKRAKEISVPLASPSRMPEAAYQLTLGKNIGKEGTMHQISEFINSDSIQQVGKIREMFEQRAKASTLPGRKERLFQGVSRVLKLRRIKTREGRYIYYRDVAS